MSNEQKISINRGILQELKFIQHIREVAHLLAASDILKAAVDGFLEQVPDASNQRSQVDVGVVARKLIAGLREEAVETRGLAALLLGLGAEYGPRYFDRIPEQFLDAVPGLVAGLRDADESVRLRVIEALGSFVNEAVADVAPAVATTALCDSSPTVLVIALKVLAKCGPNAVMAALPRLVELLQHEATDVRRQACETFGELRERDPTALRELLVVALTDNDRDVRTEAVRSLIRFDNMAADLAAQVEDVHSRDELRGLLRRIGKSADPCRLKLEALWARDISTTSNSKIDSDQSNEAVRPPDGWQLMQMKDIIHNVFGSKPGKDKDKTIRSLIKKGQLKADRHHHGVYVVNLESLRVLATARRPDLG